MKTKAFIGDDPCRGEHIHCQDKDVGEQTLLFGHRVAFGCAVRHGPCDEDLIGCVFIGEQIYEDGSRKED